MPRPPSFDRDAAIDAAMRVFWAYGYAQTPLSALTEATGLGKGSLYNAFSSKAELFLLALEAYGKRYSAPLVGALETPDIFEAVDQLLTAHAKQIASGDTPPGCMTVAGSLEGSRDAPEIMPHLEAAMNALDSAMIARIQRAVDDGQLRADVDASALGRTLTALIRGMAVAARMNCDAAALAEVRDTALKMLRGFA